jgi:hypothetical protein
MRCTCCGEDDGGNESTGCPVCRDDDYDAYCDECLRHHLAYHCVLSECQDDECSDGEEGCLEMNVDTTVDEEEEDDGDQDVGDANGIGATPSAPVRAVVWIRDPITARLVRVA